VECGVRALNPITEERAAKLSISYWTYVLAKAGLEYRTPSVEEVKKLIKSRVLQKVAEAEEKGILCYPPEEEKKHGLDT
jgi:hypothetical protein